MLGLLASSCEESKRYEISSDDTTPPGKPIFVDSRAIYGGSRVYFLPPDDDDMLYVEAAYKNELNEEVTAIASYFCDSMDVMGFKDEGEHDITLCSVDRAGNKSPKINAKIVSGQSAVKLMSENIDIIPSFGSVILSWKNPLMEPLYLYANVRYVLNNIQHDFTKVFSTSASGTQTIDSLKLYNGEDLHLSMTVKDRYKNSITPISDTTIHLLVDEELDKHEWKLLDPGTELGGVVQSDGSYNKGHMDQVIDGLTEASGIINFYEALPKNDGTFDIIIDLGGRYCLSRILTHQRFSGGQMQGNASNLRGNYYTGQNVLNYRLWIWDEDSDSWVSISRHTIKAPNVKQQADYKTLGDKGDMAFFYPDVPGFSPATRYFRFQALSGAYISEITLYGKAEF